LRQAALLTFESSLDGLKKNSQENSPFFRNAQVALEKCNIAVLDCLAPFHVSGKPLKTIQSCLAKVKNDSKRKPLIQNIFDQLPSIILDQNFHATAADPNGENPYENERFRKLLQPDTFESAEKTQELLRFFVEKIVRTPGVDSSAELVAAYFTIANVTDGVSLQPEVGVAAAAQDGVVPPQISPNAGQEPASVIMNISEYLIENLKHFCTPQEQIIQGDDGARQLFGRLGMEFSDIEGNIANRKNMEKKSAEAGLDNAVEKCLKLFNSAPALPCARGGAAAPAPAPAPALGKLESSAQLGTGQQQSKPQILARRLETFKFFMQGNECKFFEKVTNAPFICFGRFLCLA
jgi:hypothetical protein